MLSKTYVQQRNPLVIVMESLQQIEADKLAYGRKIRRTLDRQLERKQQEIEELREKNKLTEEQYTEALRKLNEEVSKSEKLVSEMAERYAKIDYDSIDDFQRQVAAYILEGELTKADSLINTKGSIEERAAEIDRIREANAQRKKEIAREQADLEKSEAMEAQKLDEFGADCYCKAEIFKMRHENDSAVYYLRLRADTDPHNINWQLDAGAFISDYIADYDLALQYDNRALDEAEQQKEDELKAEALNNIGAVHSYVGNYTEALDCFNLALKIREQIFGLQSISIANSLNNIGFVYVYQNDFSKALDYYNQAFKILDELRSLDLSTAILYDNIGTAYYKQGEFDNALDYYRQALNIQKEMLCFEHPDIALTLNNIGTVYSSLGDYEKAFEYFHQTQDILKKVVGAEHPHVASMLSNIGGIYLDLGDYSKANENFKEALEIRKKVLGEQHPQFGESLCNIGGVYIRCGEYANAFEYFQRALEVFKKVCEIDKPMVATTMNDAYNALTKAVASKTVSKEDYDDFMQDKMVVLVVAQGDTPAAAQGMSGEYVLLEFANWKCTDMTSIFDKNAELSGKPKEIVVMQDKEITRHSFDNIIGVQISVQTVGKENKERIVKMYNEWKARHDE